MFKHICLVIPLTLLAGCGGLEISSLTVEDATNAHLNEKVPGYIVYHPMIAVDVNKECKVGAPKTLPDYKKPFLLKLTQGIGKFSVDLKIEDGWRLDGIKTEADNTALLETLKDKLSVESVLPGEKEKRDPSKAPDVSEKCEPGLYKLSFVNEGIALLPIPIKKSNNSRSP